MSVNAPQPSAPTGPVTPEANLYQYLELTSTLAQAQTALASECALALSFNGLNHAVMMVSPNDLEDFVLGFSLSCGAVESIDEIYDLRLSGAGEALQADIQISMEERVSPDVVQGIREGSASIGICWDAADLSGLETSPYRSDHLAVVAHQSHPVAQLQSVRFADVLEHEFVSMPALSAVQVLLARAAAVEGKLLAHRVLVSNFDAALRVVRANLAISVVPREVAAPFAQTAPVRIVPLSDAWAQRRFAICYRDEQALSPAAQLLVQHLARASAHEAPEALA